MPLSFGPRTRLILWFVGISVVAAIVLHALVDVAYSRFVDYFVIMPIGGVLLFPLAYMADRWLTPVLGFWFSKR